MVKKLLYYANPHKGPLLLSLACRILHQTGTVAVLVIAALQAQKAFNGETISIIRDLLLPLLILGIVKAAFRYAEQLSGHAAAFRIQEHFRNLIYGKLEKDAPDNVHKLSSGELISRVISDIEKAEVFYAHTIVPVLSAAVVSLCSVFYAVYLGGVRSALILGLFLCIVGFFIPSFHLRRHYILGAEIRKNFGGLNSLLTDIVAGYSELQNWRSTGFFGEKIEKKQSALQTRLFRLSLHNGLKDGLTDVSIAAGLLWLILAYITPETQILNFFPMLCLYAASFGPVLALIKTVEDLPQTLPACQRVLDLLDREAPAEEGAVRVSGVFDHKNRAPFLSLEGLDSFAFDRPLFRFSSFAVSEGSYTVIQGKSGSGKTTLLQLMAGIHRNSPVAGTFRGCHLESSQEREQSWSRMSYVPQNTIIFPGSLRENLILRSSSGADTDKRLLDILQTVCLEDFLKKNSTGLDTMMGLRGAKVSGGEAQRIGLARALLRESDVYFLDEAFSSLDARTEQDIRRHLEAFFRNRTVVEVCHKHEPIAIDYNCYLLRDGELLQEF